MNGIVLVVRGSPTFVERAQAAASGRATVRACTLRMMPRAVAEWRPAVVVAPEELHGEPAERLRAGGAIVVELANDAAAGVVTAEVTRALDSAGL